MNDMLMNQLGKSNFTFDQNSPGSGQLLKRRKIKKKKEGVGLGGANLVGANNNTEKDFGSKYNT